MKKRTQNGKKTAQILKGSGGGGGDKGVVRDKSNLKSGHENYPKTVRFFLIGT